MESLLNWIMTMTTFFAGFTLGDFLRQPEEFKEAVRSVRRRIERVELGAVGKLPPEEMAKEGTRLKETEEAMEELLKEELKR
jgi:flavodoxin